MSDCFKGQEKLTDVEIGEYVRYIQDNAFNGCTSLTYLNIHEGLTSIGQNAFYYCNSIEKVSLPKSLKRIGSSAFMGCHSLKSIILPENISSLGYRANDLSDGPETVFKECSSLSDVICLYPASVGVPSVSSANHHILVPND